MPLSASLDPLFAAAAVALTEGAASASTSTDRRRTSLRRCQYRTSRASPGRRRRPYKLTDRVALDGLLDFLLQLGIDSASTYARDTSCSSRRQKMVGKRARERPAEVLRATQMFRAARHRSLQSSSPSQVAPGHNTRHFPSWQRCPLPQSSVDAEAARRSFTHESDAALTVSAVHTETAWRVDGNGTRKRRTRRGTSLVRASKAVTAVVYARPRWAPHDRIRPEHIALPKRSLCSPRTDFRSVAYPTEASHPRDDGRRSSQRQRVRAANPSFEQIVLTMSKR